MLRGRWLRNLLGDKNRPLEIEKLLQVFMAPNGQSPNGSSSDSDFRNVSRGQRNTELQVRRPETSILRQSQPWISASTSLAHFPSPLWHPSSSHPSHIFFLSIPTCASETSHWLPFSWAPISLLIPDSKMHFQGEFNCHPTLWIASYSTGPFCLHSGSVTWGRLEDLAKCWLSIWANQFPRSLCLTRLLWPDLGDRDTNSKY